MKRAVLNWTTTKMEREKIYQQNRTLIEEIFQKKMLPPDQFKLAIAMFCFPKCKERGVQDLMAPCKKMIDGMLEYYAQVATEDSKTVMYRDSPKELIRYRGYFTFEEINMGVRLACRGFFGKPKAKWFSLDLLNDLVILYDASDMRKHIVNTFTKYKDAQQPKLDEPTEEEKEKIVREGIFLSFEKFKKDPTKSHISIIDYRWIVDQGVAVPAWEGFKEQAKEWCKPSKNIRRITAIIDDTSVEIVAKRFAITDLYKKLIFNGYTLKQYIESPNLVLTAPPKEEEKKREDLQV